MVSDPSISAFSWGAEGRAAAGAGRTMARAGSSALAGPAGTRCPAVRPIVTSRVATFATVRTWPASRLRPTLPARRAAGAETAAPAATRARASTHAGGTAADAREVIAAASADGGHRDAAPGQPGAEEVAGVGQATAEGRLAPGQLDGGLRVGLSFQVAEHDRPAEPLGQSRELLVHRDEPIVDVGGLAGGDEVGQFAHDALAAVRPRSVAAGLHGHPVRHAVQPAADGVAAPDRPRLADQEQERRLEGVLDLGRAVQDGVADAQDHRPVPHHQRRERRLVATREVALQELAVGQAGDRPRLEQPVNLPQRGPQANAGHVVPSRRNSVSIPY